MSGPLRRPTERLWAQLSLLLFVLVQLHSAAHFALVPHQHCPTAQVVAHCSHDHGHVEEDAATEATGPEIAAEVRERLTSPTHSDEHGDRCTLLLAGEPRGVRLDSPPSVALPAQAPCVTARVLVYRVREARVEPTYRLAPKQSPPAAV